MKKNYKVANRSMSKEQYDKFVSLSKEEQTQLIYEGLDPKNMKQAVEALKDVPHGDNISKGSTKQVAGDNAADASSGGNETGTKGRGASTEKS